MNAPFRTSIGADTVSGCPPVGQLSVLLRQWEILGECHHLSCNSDVVDFSLTFGPDEECTIAETLPASVDCSGTARWHVLTPSTGEIDRLNPGFLCTVIVSGICELTVAEQELPSDVDGTPGRNRADPIDHDTIDVVGRGRGGQLQQRDLRAGDGGFQRLYDLDTALSFD